MLAKEILYFVFYFVITEAIKEESIILSISPKEVVNTFKSVVASPYLKRLADEFATKAADYLIKEMKNKEKQITAMDRKPLPEIIQPQPEYQRNSYPDISTLDEEEAMTLLEEPSPDGDNLEKESSYLSDEEIDGGGKRNIAVIGVTKINGVYYRRLLGVLL